MKNETIRAPKKSLLQKYAEVVKENGMMVEKIGVLITDDEKQRKIFSELLDSYEISKGIK